MAAKKLNACNSEATGCFSRRHSEPVPCEELREGFIGWISARFMVAKQGTLLHVRKHQHLPTTRHEETVPPFLSPPWLGGGDIEQNETCHLPTSGGKAASTWTCLAAPSRLPPTQAAKPRCLGCRVGSGMRVRPLVLFRATGRMFWEEAMEKKPGEPTPRGHSWGNKLATSIARLPEDKPGSRSLLPPAARRRRPAPRAPSPPTGSAPGPPAPGAPPR